MLRPVRALHHRELGSRVQAVKQKVRVDLCLQEFQLRLFQMSLHGKLIFLHLRFFFHRCPLGLDIGPDTAQHLMERVRDDADFIFSS